MRATELSKERIDDVRAVMDAARSERAVLYGHSEGGPMCLLFAATHPLRVSALILSATYAKRQDPDDDHPWAPLVADRDAYLKQIRRWWGQDLFVRESLKTHGPSIVEDPAARRWLGG